MARVLVREGASLTLLVRALPLLLFFALVTFFSTHFFGMRKQGVFRYIGHFVAGVPLWLKPLMFVIEIIGMLTKPFALAVRLFANMLSFVLLCGV